MLRNVLIILAVALSLLPWCGCKARTNYKYTIAVIPKGQTHEFWQSIERGSRAAAADLADAGVPVEVVWDAPLKESDTQDQIGRVQRNVSSRKVSGVVLAPQDSKRMVPVVQEAVDAGVPVVIIDSGLEKPEITVKYVATDNYNGGKLAAEHLLATLAKLGKKAPKLVLFRYAPGSESTEQREKGFLDRVNAEIKKQKDAGQETAEVIAQNDYAGATVDTAQNAAGPMLGRVKDSADGIFAVNESATAGLLNAMRSQGLIKKIAVMGFDSSAPLLRAVEAGEVIGLIVQDPYRMGYLGTWTLVRHLEGDDVSAGGKNLSTGEYLLTADNLDKEETKARFEPELQKKRKIDLPTFGKKK